MTKNRSCGDCLYRRGKPRGRGRGGRGGVAPFSLLLSTNVKIARQRTAAFSSRSCLRYFHDCLFLLLALTVVRTTSVTFDAAAAAATTAKTATATAKTNKILEQPQREEERSAIFTIHNVHLNDDWIVVIGRHSHGRNDDSSDNLLLHAQFYVDTHVKQDIKGNARERQAEAAAAAAATSMDSDTTTLDAVVCPLLSRALAMADSTWSKENDYSDNSRKRIILRRRAEDCHNRTVVDLRPFSSTYQGHEQEELQQPRFTLVATWTSSSTATVTATAKSRMPDRGQEENNNQSHNETGESLAWQWYYVWESHRHDNMDNAPPAGDDGNGIRLWPPSSSTSLEQQKALLRKASMRIRAFVTEQQQQSSFSTERIQPDNSRSNRKQRNDAETETSIDLKASLSQSGGMHRRLHQTLSIYQSSQSPQQIYTNMVVRAQILLVMPPAWFINVEDAIEQQQQPPPTTQQSPEDTNCSFRLIEPPGQVINQEEPSFVSSGYAVLLEWHCHALVAKEEASASSNTTVLQLEWDWLLHARYLEPLDDNEGDFRQIALLPPVVWSVTMRAEMQNEIGQNTYTTTHISTTAFRSHSAWLDTTPILSSSQFPPPPPPPILYTYMGAGKKSHMVPVLVITTCVSLAGAALVLYDLFRLTLPG